MIDNYMRAVFTCIALFLAVIAWRLGGDGTATAQAGQCGGNQQLPCRVVFVEQDGSSTSWRIARAIPVVAADAQAQKDPLRVVITNQSPLPVKQAP